MRFFLNHLPAVLLGVVLNAGASAAVIHFASEEIPIPINFAGVSVDLETGSPGGVSNSLSGLTNGDANFYFGGARISNDADSGAATPTWQPVRTGTTQTSSVANLIFGTPVNGATLFYASTGTPFGSSSTHITGTAPNGFNDNVSGYIGFSMIPNAGGGPWYGWMRVTLQNDDGDIGTIHEWAYEDTGAAILVGATIPEPGSGALALLGLGALALRRRRS